MKVLERIFEEIDKKADYFEFSEQGKEHVRMVQMVEVEDIIRKYLNDGDWIPCSEMLPKEGEYVLVWFEYFRFGDYNRLFQTYGLSYQYDGRFTFVNGSSGWKMLRVIAWQPLPTPYKEKK